MIAIELKGDREVVAYLQAAPARARAGVARGIMRLGLELQKRMQDKVSGDVLRVKSGALRSSLDLRVEEGVSSVSAIVGRGAVEYAGYHEYGVPHSWTIRPKSAQVLAFEWHGQQVFRRQVTHPALPERSFARAALKEIESQVAPVLTEEIAAALRS